MGKDAYWFKHDSNAKDDPKCVLLIEQLGLEGYGIYWVLIEMLRDQPDYRYPLALIPAIARRYNTTAEKMKTVVQSYGLFGFDEEDFFFSNSLRERMALYDGKREKRRMAANVRWGNIPAIKAGEEQEQYISNASAMQVHSKCNAIREDKTREEKRREDKTSKDGPGPDDLSFVKQVIDYLNEKTGSRYRPNTAKTRSFILARQKEGYKLEDFISVIDKKTTEWKGTDMEKYLRPETLFSPSKFENYLNQPAKQRAKTGGKRPAGFEERQYTDDFFDQFYEEI